MADPKNYLDKQGVAYLWGKIDSKINAETTFTNTEKTINAVGGIKAGTDLSGMSFNEIIDAMFFPYTKPTVGTASVTPSAGVYEKGETITITKIAATVTRKSKDIAKVEFLQGSTVIATEEDGVASGGTFSIEPNKDITANTTFAVRATDTADTPGSTTGGAATFTFVDPMYQGALDADAELNGTNIAALTKVVQSKGNKTFTMTANQQYLVFAYPKSYGALKSVVDQNGFDVTGTFVRSEVTVTTKAGESVAYYVYKSATTTSVTSFKNSFNFS